jgi:hypothetical protein
MRSRSITALALAGALLLPALAAAQCEDWLRGPLDDGTLPNGADGTIRDSITWDPDGAGPLQERLVVGGTFTSIGGVPAQHVAMYDPATGQWAALGPGIPASVLCLVVYNGQLVAGCVGDNNVGTFDETVLRWTGSAWEGMSATNTGSVYDMTVFGGELFIGGTFMTHFVPQPGGPAHYIARWLPGSNLWDDVPEADFGSQTNTAVRALAEYNGQLCAAGYKASPQSITGSAIHLTRGTPGGALWATATDGTDPGGIYDLDVFGGELLVAGGFLEVNGLTCRNIAGWNGSSFHAFGAGVASPSPQASTVWGITIHEGIVICGDFATADGVTVNRVAFWPPGGSAWQARGTGMDDTVYDVTSFRGELVGVGDFANAGVPANRIAHWNGTLWSPFGGGSVTFVTAFVNWYGRLVAAGSFSQPTQALGTANNIAAWNGGALSSFDTGTNGSVYALEGFKYSGINGSYELIAGGTFTAAGGLAATRIARWNERPNIAFPPPAWAAMGAGFNSTVYAIERMGTTTYAGGAFTASGVTSTPGIARWNETTDVWEYIGTLNGTVYALKEFGGYLYAGGSFTTANGVATGGLARWNGSSWSQVGGTFLGTVRALEVFDGSLVIGGQFPGLAGAANIARYDGFNYYNLGSGGTNGSGVRALRTNGSRLYAAGSFTSVGGVSANNIGWWDGAAWHDASGGTNGFVHALGVQNGELNAGGQFSTVKGGLLASPAWARYTETGLPWISQQPYPFSQTVAPGADVTFSATAGGGFPGVTFQWRLNGEPLVNGPTPHGSVIAGAQSEVLTITDVAFADQGRYSLEVGNGCGSVASFDGTLRLQGVSATPTPREPSLFLALGPNPTGGESTLSFSLAREARVRYRVHDLRGYLVREVDLGNLPAGRFEARWDTRDRRGNDVATGIYFVSLEMDGQRLGAKRLTVVR